MPKKTPSLPEETKRGIMASMSEHQPFEYSIHLEGRLARLEAQSDYVVAQLNDFKKELKDFKKESNSKVDRNFFWTLGMFIALLGVMAKGFGWIG